MKMKFLLSLAAVLFGFSACATDVLVDANDFGANPASGRIVTYQILEPFPSNLFTNVTDDNGQFTISNAKVADYSMTIRSQGGAGSITFQFTVTANNLGTVSASTITSQLGIQTYPVAGKASWTILAADQRYQLAGTTLSNTFYPLYSNPSNYVNDVTLQANTNGFADARITNGLTPITLLNSASNSIVSQIVSGAVTAAQVTNISVYVANTTSNLLWGNALGQINITSNFLAATSQTIANTTSNLLQAKINTLGANDTNYVNVTSNSLAGLQNASNSWFQVSKVDSTNGYSTGQTFQSGLITNSVLNGQTAIQGTSRWATTNALGFLYPLFFDWNSGSSDFGAITHSTVWSFAHTNVSTASGSFSMQSDNFTKNANVSSSSANLANIGFQWLLYPFGGSQTVFMQLTTNGLWASRFYGDGNGLTNTSTTNLVGTALTQVTNIASSFSGAGAITNAIGTNFPNGLLANQTLYYPTNDPTIASNWFQVSKVDVTGGFSTNQFLKAAVETNATLNGLSVITGSSRWATTNATGVLFPFFFDWNAASSDFGAITHSSSVWSFAHTNASTASGSLSMTSDSMTKSANVSSSSPNLANIGFQWLLYPFGGSQTVYMQLTTNGLWASQFYGDGTGLTNTSAATLQPSALAQVTNVANGIAVASIGLTNAYGTNFPNGLVANQILYYPTNDPTIASNWFQKSKMDSTNGFAINPTFTNSIGLEGIVSIGPVAGDPVIYSSTNVIVVLTAGTSIATNGPFVWSPSGGCYTNWVSGSIYTNNGSAWLLQNPVGTTLYSLSGANPAGTSTAVGGVAPNAIMAVGGYIDGNHLPIFGPLAVTNVNAISNALATTVMAGATTNYVTTQNGFSTNQYINGPFETNWANPEKHFFQFSANGMWATNIGSGFGAAILGGATNRIVGDGAGLIAGGAWNLISGGGGNADVIVGGSYNQLIGSAGISSIDANFMGGGYSNKILNVSAFSTLVGGFDNAVAGGYSSSLGGLANTNLGQGSTILGGASNRVTGAWSTAAGQNATITHDDSFSWSDGTIDASRTNSQFRVTGTNGLYVNGPLWLNGLNTNSGIYIMSNAPFSLWAVTNSMPNFCHWIGNSNGVTVDIYTSNGVIFMKNLWQ